MSGIAYGDVILPYDTPLTDAVVNVFIYIM